MHAGDGGQQCQSVYPGPDSIKAYEENVRLSRRTFNDTVTRFNNQVRMFPGSLVASMLGFAPKEYLADDVSKAEYPDF